MYDFYENFYKKAVTNHVFKRFCETVYGTDFSQDGFSDLNELNDLIEKTGINDNSVVLDIGCGNGGLCEFIHKKTGAVIYGYDYSETAIQMAKERSLEFPKLCFDVGAYGKMEYPDASFDVVLAVDTMYFVDDPKAFVEQITGWLKPDGVFAAMYGCFDEIETDIGRDDNSLARALREAGLDYRTVDYTENHYRIMRKRRITAELMREDFKREELEPIADRVITESIDADMTLEDFKRHYSRFMYIADRTLF